MSYQEIYKLHYSKLVRNGILKSLIIGALFGFAVSAIIAFVTVFTEFNGLWLSLICLVAVTAAVAAALYFIFFRPNEKTAIAKLDRLGFDERFITMRELEGDDSPIAKMQREEAVNALTDAYAQSGAKVLKPEANGFIEKLRAFGLSLGWIIASLVVALVGVTTIVITGIPSTRQGIVQAILPTPYYSVNYNSDNGYFHDGNGYMFAANGKSASAFIQSVISGGASTNVVAEAFNMYDLYERYVAEYGEEALADFELVYEYYFKGWSDGWTNSDGYADPSRSDANITGDINVTAMYGTLEIPTDIPKGGSGGSGDGNGEGGGDNNDAPPNPNGDSSGSNGSTNYPPDLDDNNNGAGSNVTSTNGEVRDGVTDYHEFFETYYDDVMQMLADGQELPAELRQIVETYISALK